MIIVIDGPAGSGKSSTAKALASICNLVFLDSGALYRTVTLLWLQENKPDDKQFYEALSSAQIHSSSDDSLFRVYLHGKDVSKDIRKSSVAECVSEVAKKPFVRSYVNQIMRRIVQTGSFIADGRDLGTAVFPDADLKFFMDASVEERARRRFKELKKAEPENKTITYEDVLNNVRHRDKVDSQREMDPLAKADDAILIDTTGLTFEEQLKMMSDYIKKLKHKP